MNGYYDNAAMKPLLPEVKEVIRGFLDADVGNPSAVYSRGRTTKTMISEARAMVAKAIGADSDEIYFTSGSTEAVNAFFRSTDKHIACPKIEHKAIVKQADDNVSLLEVERTGTVNERAVRNVTRLYGKDCAIVIGYVNNEIGTIQPIKEITQICHEAGAEIFVDGTQAIGNLPVNIHELGVDYLCGSFGKLGGLTGCGFLYVKKGNAFPPIQVGGAQERGLRAGTENILGIIAGAKAVEVGTQNLEAKIKKVTQQRDEIVCRLLRIPRTHLNGSLKNRVCNNINIAFEGIEAESLVLTCDMYGLQISAGSACNSVSIEPSHVLKAIGLSDDLAKSSVRITLGDNNDVDFVVDAITNSVEKLRSMSPMWKEISG